MMYTVRVAAGKSRCFSTAGNYTGLSSLPDHYTERSRCLDDFRDMYGGELILPHATFIIESLITIPRRNRTLSRYHNLTRNASRSFFLRSHNMTKSKSFNMSEQQRLYESFLAQRTQNYSRSNLLRSSNMMSYSRQSRSSNNMTQIRQQYHNAYQAPLQGQHSRHFNASQLQRSHQQSHPKPLKGEQWRHFNGSQFQRQNHKPYLELKPVGGQRRNSVSKNSIR